MYPTGTPEIVPTTYQLFQNHPNPFNPMTTIRFDLPKVQTVRLTIYTVDGKVVTTLINENMPQGNHEVVWSGLDDAGRLVASGTYIYRLEAGDYMETKRMLLVK